MRSSEYGIYGQLSGMFASIGIVFDGEEDIKSAVNVGVQGSVVIAGYASAGIILAVNLDNPSLNPYSDDFIVSYDTQSVDFH